MKTASVVVLCVIAVAAAIFIRYYRHTMVLERRYVAEFSAIEIEHDGVRVVRVSGLCGHSSMSVKDITSKRVDSSIVILVHIFIVRPGTTGYFHYDVPVPDGINEIRFGKDDTVIWRRGASDSSSTVAK